MQGMNSPQEVKVYDFIKKFKEDNRYNPTLQEIADGTGLNSAVSARSWVNRLVKKGLATKTNGHRTIEIAEVSDAKRNEGNQAGTKPEAGEAT